MENEMSSRRLELWKKIELEFGEPVSDVIVVKLWQ